MANWASSRPFGPAPRTSAVEPGRGRSPPCRASRQPPARRTRRSPDRGHQRTHRLGVSTRLANHRRSPTPTSPSSTTATLDSSTSAPAAYHNDPLAGATPVTSSRGSTIPTMFVAQRQRKGRGVPRRGVDGLALARQLGRPGPGRGPASHQHLDDIKVARIRINDHLDAQNYPSRRRPVFSERQHRSTAQCVRLATSLPDRPDAVPPTCRSTRRFDPVHPLAHQCTFLLHSIVEHLADRHRTALRDVDQGQDGPRRGPSPRLARRTWKHGQW